MDTLFETGQDGSVATTHDWLTPPWILKALGPFDLDPCASQHQPWPTASRHFTILDNGLSRKWEGRVWCNPPYGSMPSQWLARCANHRNAIALIFARTETAMFQDHVFARADGLLFLRGRVRFHLPGGAIPSANNGPGTAGAPSVLVAYGRENAKTLLTCGIPGAYLPLEHRA